MMHRTIQVIAEKPINVLYRTLYRTKVNFSSRDSLHLLEECRDQMQVSVIGSHDTGIFQKKRTLPTYIRIKKANITLFLKKNKKIIRQVSRCYDLETKKSHIFLKKIIKSTKRSTEYYKKYILHCVWICDILQINNNCS